MRKYKTRKRQTLTDICCDVCSASCKTPLDDYEVATLSAQWGYHSRQDGESYHLDLCEDCFEDVLAHIGQRRLQKMAPPLSDENVDAVE